MTYAEAKIAKHELEAICNRLAGPLAEHPRNAMGLVIARTPEYVTQKQEYDTAFAKLRAFNGQYVKVFKKELLADRNARREALQLKHA